MNANIRTSAESPAAPVELSTPVARRRIDRIDEPARALGAKRAALHLRRQQRSSSKPHANSTHAGSSAGTLILASQHAGVGFVLRPTRAGLLIERTQRHALGAQLVQTMVLADAASFERWCAAEPLRFDDPVLYEQLCRAGHDRFDGQR